MGIETPLVNAESVGRVAAAISTTASDQTNA